MIRPGEASLWGVFQQSGLKAIAAEAEVGIALASEPGVVRWTKIIEVLPGTAGGQVSANASLPSQGDVGSSRPRYLWPSTGPKTFPRGYYQLAV